MNKTIPLGITVFYFNDKSKNIYAELPPDKEQAKRLSKRIYKTAMTALVINKKCHYILDYVHILLDNVVYVLYNM